MLPPPELFQSQLGSIGAGDNVGGQDLPTRLSIPAWFDWRGSHRGAGEGIRQAFNPSLVRLARSRKPAPTSTSTNFQSQLGSIGARVAHRYPLLAPDFQSQLGSIGAQVRRFPSSFTPTFQSQLGSIGATHTVTPRRSRMNLSIPAWFDWRLAHLYKATHPRMPFNPSLVRLAPRPSYCFQASSLIFQSQLGSIGAYCHCKGRPPFRDFQSQLGSIGALPSPSTRRLATWLSIPAWFDWRQPLRRCVAPPYLLSIPAWFDWRPYRPGLPGLAGTAFNPSLVRLALLFGPPGRGKSYTFNPSLVRLARHRQWRGWKR